MGEELSINNMMSDAEIENLFVDYEEPEEPKETPEEPSEKKEEKQTTENVNPETLFDDDEGGSSESVSSGKDNKEQGDQSSSEESDSPNSNFYSSIAKAFEEDGVFPDLSSDDIKAITDAESLREAIDKQIKAQFDERYQRINEALEIGVEPSAIRQYENTLAYIDSITDEAISQEDDQGETLRKNLIFQDFLNRGYSKQRAEREVKKSLDAGTDIEDAKEALDSNRQFFQEQYEKLRNDAKEASDKIVEERKKQADTLKKSILEDKELFGETSVDKATRKKIYDNITKPVYKDPESGVFYTAIQKYSKENPVEFQKNLGLVFTLTDGFKNLDGLVKGKVKKEVAKGMRNLENVINSTSRNSDGSLNFTSGVSDTNSFFKGYSLDI